MTTTTDRVVVDDAPISAAELVRVARGAALELGPIARRRIAASRIVVDGLVDGDDLIYGLNTGLGHLRDSRIPRDELETAQAVLVRAHAGAFGPPLPTEVVRAAMAVRVAGIGRGGSGASVAIADTYCAMLEAGIHPVVPTVGSVGAADLMHMATIALAAMGSGEVEVNGRIQPAAEALRAAAIAPLRLAPKDGLTVISSNGVGIGHTALAIGRAAEVADAADVVVAVSLEAIAGNPSIVDPAIAAAKGVPGQVVAADRIRALLAGSRIFSAGGPSSVQDPLSFRVAPQVHGALRETIAFALRALEAELGAAADNPLVVAEEGRMISNGNFHPIALALAVDALRPAMAHVGQLSDRRCGTVWDRLVTDPELLTAAALERLAAVGSPLLRYTGAARTAELRTLAGPATLDVAPLDVGVEDHATNAPLAARRTDEAVGLLWDILAVELLTATASLTWADRLGELGGGTGDVVTELTRELESLGPAVSSASVHAAARAFLERGPRPATH